MKFIPEHKEERKAEDEVGNSICDGRFAFGLFSFSIRSLNNDLSSLSLNFLLLKEELKILTSPTEQQSVTL